VRGVDAEFNAREIMLGIQLMKYTVTEENIVQEIKQSQKSS
jgi:hypothetical protein